MSSSSNKTDNKYIGSVKVGQKGQIVIPKEARDMFDIKHGDTLLIMADKSQGIAVLPGDAYDELFDQIMKTKSNTEDLD